MNILFKRTICIFLLLSMLVIPNFNQTSYAYAEDVVVPKAFIQSVKNNIPVLYKKEFKTLTKNETKSLNFIMSLNRKQLLHALAEIAGESQTSQKMVIDFFSRYLMQDYVLFINELVPHPKDDLTKRRSAYKILLAVSTPKHQAILEKELAENKNFGVRWSLYYYFVDTQGDAALDILLKVIPTEKNQEIMSSMINFTYEVGERHPELLRKIVQPYLKVGGTTAKNVYLNLLSIIYNREVFERRLEIWTTYLIYNLDDPASAKLWKDLQASSGNWQIGWLKERFKDKPVIMKRLEEMEPTIEDEYISEY